MSLPSDFTGPVYRLANNWTGIVPDELSEKKINYLEIGAFLGLNLFSVWKTYGKHPESQMYCVDPWEDYSEYIEYKDEQENNFKKFKKHTKDISNLNVVRGYSREKVPEFEDDFFDLIYIDANHEPDYVLEDAVLAFRKLKVNGYMIFDDYGNETQFGIDAFSNGYYKRIKELGIRNYQVFIQKIK